MFQTGFSRSQAYLGIGKMIEWLPSFWLSKIWIFPKLSWLIIWDILNSNFNFFFFFFFEKKAQFPPCNTEVEWFKRSFFNVTQRWSDLIPSSNCFFVVVFAFCFCFFFWLIFFVRKNSTRHHLIFWWKVIYFSIAQMRSETNVL